LVGLLMRMTCPCVDCPLPLSSPHGMFLIVYIRAENAVLFLDPLCIHSFISYLSNSTYVMIKFCVDCSEPFQGRCLRPVSFSYKVLVCRPGRDASIFLLSVPIGFCRNCLSCLIERTVFGICL
jgi:hypothetical protein